LENVGRADRVNHGGQRRVPGLRRGEVAMLAGVSVAYYTRLERGNLGGDSEVFAHPARPASLARQLA
jgi:Helix-turn-helix domain